MIPLKHETLVVPVDFSPDSVAAIRAGLDRVEDPADLHVVHVLPTLDYASHGVLREFAAGSGNREADARNRVEDLIRQAAAQGARIEILTGDPGLATADYAKRVDAELIVVTSHGRHGVRRLLLGSTAERIIRHAHCSVLVLRRSDAT